jgi:hypothetical protein
LREFVEVRGSEFGREPLTNMSKVAEKASETRLFSSLVRVAEEPVSHV